MVHTEYTMLMIQRRQMEREGNDQKFMIPKNFSPGTLPMTNVRPDACAGKRLRRLEIDWRSGIWVVIFCIPLQTWGVLFRNNTQSPSKFSICSMARDPTKPRYFILALTRLVEPDRPN